MDEAVVVLFVEQGFALEFVVAVVVKIAQVAVEFDFVGEGKTDQYDYRKYGEYPFVAVEGEAVEAFDGLESGGFAVSLGLLQEMRQENQRKYGAAGQGQGGEHPEIAQQVALCEQKAQESAYGGECSQEHGG